MLQVECGPLKLANPIMTASGTFGYGPEMSEFFDLTVPGAVVVKTVTLNPRAGNPAPRMVEVGTALAKKNGLANLVYKLGDIENVPLPDKSVDAAILSQALHHAQHPQAAVDEAYRILKPGGQLLVLDLNEHSFEKARDLYADVWLGFKESTLHAFLKKAGFGKVEVAMVAREAEEPFFETLLATATKIPR